VNAGARRLVCILLSGWTATAVTATESPTVVADEGGVSALPYYRALHLLPSPSQQPTPAAPVNGLALSTSSYIGTDVLPVHSSRLSPGSVERRLIQAPGLSPLCLIGDDRASRAWLQKHLDTLRSLYAICLVVNVDRREALDSLRKLASGLTLSAVSADDLAQRLSLEHYPVLITSTSIEQ
jgi:integrating conjugative element protein (TIGR03765 family)